MDFINICVGLDDYSFLGNQKKVLKYPQGPDSNSSNTEIHRVHFTVLSNNTQKGKCKFCGHKIPGIWD